MLHLAVKPGLFSDVVRGVRRILVCSQNRYANRMEVGQHIKLRSNRGEIKVVVTAVRPYASLRELAHGEPWSLLVPGARNRYKALSVIHKRYKERENPDFKVLEFTFVEHLPS